MDDLTNDKKSRKGRTKSRGIKMGDLPNDEKAKKVGRKAGKTGWMTYQMSKNVEIV